MSEMRLHKTEKLKWLAIALILTCLVQLDWIHYIAANPGFSGRDLYLDDLPSEAAFIINTDGSDVWTTRYDGDVTYSGSNFVSVTQSAMDALTAGRDWQEKIVFKGDFTIDSTMMNDLPLQVPSYTELDFGQSRITYTGTNKSKNILENADRTSGNVHITIRGGFFDGQRGATSYQDAEGAGYQSVGDCILWQKVDNSRIAESYISSFAGNAFALHTCRNNSYEYLTAEDCGGYGQFEQTAEQDGSYLYCRAINSNDGGVGVDGFDWCTNTLRDTFIGCEAINNSYGFANFGGERNSFIRCKAIENGLDGFYLQGADSLYSCLSKNNGWDGGGDGVYVDSGADNAQIIGGQFYDDQTPKTQNYGIQLHATAENVTVIGADVRGNKNAAINVGGSAKDDMIRDCLGFVTENGGVAIDKADSGTIAHGLAGTPDIVTLTSLNATYDNEGVIAAWDKPNTDATNISLDIHWANGTAISDAVIDVSWYAEYKP